MNQKEQKQDPRFYYIRIIKIEEPKQESKVAIETGNYLLKFQLGTKISTTTFQIAALLGKQEKNSKETNKQLQRVKQEAHIFKYGAEQFMNVFLEPAEQQSPEREREGPKAKGWVGTSAFSGFSRILLPPLIEHPHTCHEVMLPLIAIKDKQDITGKPILYLTIELYFQLGFKGTLDIIPLSATIARSIVPVGEMRPVIEMKIENQQWLSLDAGGIHPHWSGHYHTKRQKDKENPMFWNVSNIEGNIEANKWDLQQRHLSHLCNLSSVAKQAYFDIARFELKSAGSYLDIKIYSQPFKEKPSTVVGSSLIRIQNSNFLKHPRHEKSLIFTEHEVDLFNTQGEQSQFVGKLYLLVRFIFDRQRVVNANSYTYEISGHNGKQSHNGAKLY